MFQKPLSQRQCLAPIIISSESLESVPFLEYELHRQLLYKLRVLGMNAAFRLQLQLTIGPQLIVGVASATAVYLPALPAPIPLKITRHIATKVIMGGL